MQPQFMQPIFVKVECYDNRLNLAYNSVIQIKDILEVARNYVLFTNGQIAPLTEESAKQLQDFLLEFYSNKVYQERLASQPTIQLS